jgi:hypothetical protein
VLAGISTIPADAAEPKVYMLPNPDAYLVGRGPQTSEAEQRAAQEAYERAVAESKAEQAAQTLATGSAKERAAAVISGNYTVIPNATPGFDSNFSFIRFPNFNSDRNTTTTVQIVGDATGTDYGTATVDAPPYSSPQRSITELYQSIGGTSFNPADTTVTLYLQNNQVLTGVQHVYYSSASDFFENMSACTHVDGVSYIPMGSAVVNVHTSTLLTRFPSVVKVHNKNAFTTLLRLRVHDGPTGNLLGIIGFNAAANSTYAFGSQALEAAIGYIPTGADFHMNVFFDSDPSTPPNAIISHTVTNVRVAGAVLNLTTICNIND